MVCVKIIIKGHVQGVGFRYATLQKARQLTIKGFVKNQVNGTVCIEACAEENRLNSFIKWCYDGPSHARVHQIDTEPLDAKNFTTFEIR